MCCSRALKRKKRRHRASSCPLRQRKNPWYPRVVAAGPGTDDVKMTVKKGDKVITGKFAGQELKLDGEDYVICKLADILAIVD